MVDQKYQASPTNLQGPNIYIHPVYSTVAGHPVFSASRRQISTEPGAISRHGVRIQGEQAVDLVFGLPLGGHHWAQDGHRMGGIWWDMVGPQLEISKNM